ncbi:MAG: HAMP domain-containing histidine kinase [Nitrososphaerota archaeon]|nr:HAMP domain-containing histidine kinase [Nitrososphaerota archaeon]
MSDIELAKSRMLANVLARNEMYKQKLKIRLSEIKQEVQVANEEVIKRRTLYHKRVVENLNAKSEQIYLRHQEVAGRLNKEAIRREVNIRVNRGLESLEEFISILRLSNWSDLAIKDAIHDPAIATTPSERLRRVTISKFVKSIQRQLIEQTEFVNIAAHELRTPIMPILVNAEILDQELGGRDEVRIIMRNALRLQRLAQNILDVARLNAGTLPLKRTTFDLNELIREIIEDEETRVNKSSIRLEFTEKDTIELVADRDRISQVLLNLIGNSIKFTDNGTIRIAAEKHEDYVLVSVIDNGRGIDSEVFPILFSRFGKSYFSGTGMGLGLYISKSIVESHGGTISARNNDPPESGATFSFTIPVDMQKLLNTESA